MQDYERPLYQFCRSLVAQSGHFYSSEEVRRVTGKFVAVLVSLFLSSTGAHRPPLSVAKVGARNAAWYQCMWVMFPLDPQEQRCLSWGAGWKHQVCHGGDSWCFPDAYATNNARRTILFRLRVVYVCSTCLEYRVWISNVRALA